MQHTRTSTGILKDLRDHGGILPEEAIRDICGRKNAVLLESTSSGSEGSETLVFLEPTEVVRAIRVQEVMPALVRAQMYLEQGFYVAGYISYEAGPAFLPVPARDPSDDPPYLLWLGVFRDAIRAPRDPSVPVPESASGSFTIGQVEPSVNEADYLRSMAVIRRYLEEGNSYQVNFTFPVTGRWSGTLADLYLRLRSNQPVAYGSIIRHPGCSLLSFSPELFFSVRDRSVLLKPMKGTAPRGKTSEEDQELVRSLEASEKDRAENRMIVDLLRNDIGKIAREGSVKVRSFFDIETYESILQATSTITAELRNPPSLVDLFQALFPSGSITGAPKRETMRIIHEVEGKPRGPYTGTIGYASPHGDMAWNVAIRTLLADQRTGVFQLNVGSGVTIASDPVKEYQECLQKALFVTREPSDFKLFETILWVPGRGYAHLRSHLSRMRSSAEYFGWKYSGESVTGYLERTVSAQLSREEQIPHRIRIMYDRKGTCAHTIAKLEPLPEPVLVGFSKRTLSSADRFQYHKTTRRQTYDIVLEEAAARGWFDAIVLNERGEVAEGARSNVFIERDGVLMTPPVTAGILPGTERARILSSRGRKAVERTLFRSDILEAKRVYLSNALRGLMEVEVVW